MLPLSEVKKLNRELADRINREALSNPQSPYANKFVGIANGQVVVVEDDLETMVTQLEKIEPENQRTMCLEASLDYSVVEEIWDVM